MSVEVDYDGDSYEADILKDSESWMLAITPWNQERFEQRHSSNYTGFEIRKIGKLILWRY